MTGTDCEQFLLPPWINEVREVWMVVGSRNMTQLTHPTGERPLDRAELFLTERASILIHRTSMSLWSELMRSLRFTV